METKVEGILISKIYYKERDILGKLLLRSGKKISVIFYGGRGGGKKKKSSILELGYMLKVELGRSSIDLYPAREWTLLWSHRSIRNDYRQFSVMCFFLEMAQKVSMEDDLKDTWRDSDKDSEGVFNVISNSIFYLDQEETSRGKGRVSSQITLFISKLLLVNGLSLQLDSCCFCGGVFTTDLKYSLYPLEGGIICNNCSGGGEYLSNDLIYQMRAAYSEKYKDLLLKKFSIDFDDVKIVLNYFVEQFNMNHNFLSLNALEDTFKETCQKR